MIVEVEKRYKVTYDVDDITLEEYKQMTDIERLHFIDTLDDCAYSRDVSESEMVKADVFVGKIEDPRLKIDELPLKVDRWSEEHLTWAECVLLANGYKKAAKAIRYAIRDAIKGRRHGQD
jgi:hypothetical protein